MKISLRFLMLSSVLLTLFSLQVMSAAVDTIEQSGATSINEMRIAHMQMNEGHNYDIPDGFLRRAKKLGYTHILVDIFIDHCVSWEPPCKEKFEDWDDVLRIKISKLFTKVDSKGLKMIPLFATLNPAAAAWHNINDNIPQQKLPAELFGTTEYQSVPFAPNEEFDGEFSKLITAVFAGFNDAVDNGLGYNELEYIHLGFDEPVERRDIDNWAKEKEIEDNERYRYFLSAGLCEDDRDWIKNNVKDLTSEEQLIALMGDSIARKVETIKAAGQSTDVMFFADIFDPSHIGGFTANSGNDQRGLYSFKDLENYDEGTTKINTTELINNDDFQSVKDDIVLLPWVYDYTFNGIDYDTASTLTHFADAGVRFIFAHTMGSEVNTSEQYQSRERQLDEIVDTVRHGGGKIGKHFLGYSAQHYASENQYWDDNKPTQHRLWNSMEIIANAFDLYSPIATMGAGFDSYPRVYSFNKFNQIQELAWSEDNQQWEHNNMSATANAPAAVASSPIAAMGVGADRFPRVYYFDEARQVQELAWSEHNLEFEHSIVSKTAGAEGSPIAAMGVGADRFPRVYYFDEARQVQELAWSEHNLKFEPSIVSKTAGAEGSPIAAMGVGANRFPRVYYFNENHQVQELAWSEDNLIFEHKNVGTTANAPAAEASSPIAVMGVGADRFPRVYYFDEARQVQELAWSEDNLKFEHRNVSAETGAPPALNGSPISAMGVGANRFPRVYYFDDARQVQELAWSEENQRWERRSLPANVNQLVDFQEMIPEQSWTPDGCPAAFPGGKYSFTGALVNESDRKGPFIPQGKSLTNVLVEIEELTNGNMLMTGDGNLITEGNSFAIPKVGGYADSVLSPTEKEDVPFSVCLKTKDKFDLFVNVLAAQE